MSVRDFKTHSEHLVLDMTTQGLDAVVVYSGLYARAMGLETIVRPHDDRSCEKFYAFGSFGRI